MSLLRGAYICRQCIRKHSGLQQVRRAAQTWAATSAQHAENWAEQTRRIQEGQQQRMLSILEERGLVKDVAGGHENLDKLLTEKRIGAYVGVDPTAPSLHVGHLLPLMVLFWLYMHGFQAVTLVGGGTVKIGDPSGRTTAREQQEEEVHSLNTKCIRSQIQSLWTHVKALGIKHHYSKEVDRFQVELNNSSWLNSLTAVRMMSELGSGMRLGTMLSRDSVQTRMQGGDGMSIAEFLYPMFQAWDWWHMFKEKGVQLQIGGSDQYGNICAGMDAVNYLRKNDREQSGWCKKLHRPLEGTFGLTTPLLTTSSGEKFGKSAGNAVWLDKDMMSSFDLYQYFLKTSDDDVERYLKLFTFIPVDYIKLVIAKQNQDPGKRVAQHLLAKELVELAHGHHAANIAERAHKEAFKQGTASFSLDFLRKSLQRTAREVGLEKDRNAPLPHRIEQEAAIREREQLLLQHKERYLDAPKNTSDAKDAPQKVVYLPMPMVHEGSFSMLLYAAGLVSSKSEAHRLIRNGGAYVAGSPSGEATNPNELKWVQITSETGSPADYLIDYEAIVLRTGKSKIQICRVLDRKLFEQLKITVPGWLEFREKLVASSC